MAIEDPSTVSKLRFADLKPYFSGSVWRINSQARQWDPDLLRYATALFETVEKNLPALVKLLVPEPARRSSGAGQDADRERKAEYLKPIFCNQRGTSLRSDGAEPPSAGEQPTPIVEWRDDIDSASDLQPKGLVLGGFVYRSLAPPAWVKGAIGADFEALRWELVYLALAWPYVLVSTTGDFEHRRLVDIINAWMKERGGAYWVDEVPTELLDTAFIGEETTRTSLVGVHRPVRNKADRKSIAGQDMRYVIDPLVDQTYAYSSGRAHMRISALPQQVDGVGVDRLVEAAFPKSRPAGRRSNKQSKSATEKPKPKASAILVGYTRATHMITLGPTPGIIDLARRLDIVRLLLDETEKRRNATAPGVAVFGDRIGLDYLASPTSAAELAAVREPFEAEFSALRSDGRRDINDRLREALDSWERHGSIQPRRLSVDGLGGLTLPMRVYWNGEKAGALVASIDRRDERVQCEVKISSVRGEAPLELRELLDDLIQAGEMAPIDLRFESGHVLADGSLFKPALKEVLFENWRWLPAKIGDKPYSMTDEKPEAWAFGSTKDPSTTIQASCSLFSRIASHVEDCFDVRKSSSSWALLCHDQPEEVADFIFVDSAPGKRRLEFVHVKSAGGAKERSIAIGPYEKVVPQAIKNLRHLDTRLLHQRFIDAKRAGQSLGTFCVYAKSGSIAWSDDTAPFHQRLETLANHGPAKKSKVICYAPHVREMQWTEQLERRDNSATSPSRAAYMLSMLLLNARSACTGFNADFEVWSEAKPATL